MRDLVRGESIRETLDIIELARDRSRDTIRFLEAVRDNLWQEIGAERPIAVALRLQAAEILRKFASLPTNVSVDLGTRTEIVYEGDRGVEPDVAKSSAADIPVLPRPDAEPEAVGRPRSRKAARSA